MTKNKEIDMTDVDLEELIEKASIARKKEMLNRKLPEKRSLVNSLQSLTRERLQDIKYNLNIDKKVSDSTKAKMAREIAPYVMEIFKSWVTDIIEDQAALLDFLSERDGISKDIRSEDARIDILVNMGVLNCGVKNDEIFWYLPDEILEIYRGIQGPKFRENIRLNDDIVRLSAGLVYYYGLIDYDTLFEKIKAYTEVDDMEFADFLGVIFTGGLWCPSVSNAQHDLFSSVVIAPEALTAKQASKGMQYAEFPYDKVYDAGEEGYIESTAEFREMAQYLMKTFHIDIIPSGEIMKVVYSMLQNEVPSEDIVQYVIETASEAGTNSEENDLSDIVGRLLEAYKNTLPLWILRGHTIAEVANQDNSV